MQKTIQEPIVPISTILGLDYETTSYDQRVKARYDYVKKQLEEDPNYEGWDYLEYIGYEDKSDSFINFNYLVSTTGWICSVREGKYRLLNGTVLKSGYRAVELAGDDSVIRRVNRIVASTYVPVLTDQDPTLLITNHIDLDKLNNNFINFEWVTQKDNVKHAHDNGNHKPYVHKESHYYIKWYLDDEYFGEIFYVGDLEVVKSLVYDWSSVRKSMTDNKISYGGGWFMLDLPGGYPPLPDFIKDKISNDKPYVNLRTYPILVNTPSGLSFTMYGGDEIRSCGFYQSEVHKAVRFNKEYRHCTFKRITRKEANKYPRGKP